MSFRRCPTTTTRSSRTSTSRRCGSTTTSTTRRTSTTLNAALEGTEWEDRPSRSCSREPGQRPRGQADGRPQQRRRPRQPHAVLGDHGPGRRRRAVRATSAAAIDRPFGGFDAFKEMVNDGRRRPLRQRLGLAHRRRRRRPRASTRPRTRTPAHGGRRARSSASTSGSTPTTSSTRTAGPTTSTAWWNVVNWDAVAENYAAAVGKSAARAS